MAVPAAGRGGGGRGGCLARFKTLRQSVDEGRRARPVLRFQFGVEQPRIEDEAALAMPQRVEHLEGADARGIVGRRTMRLVAHQGGFAINEDPRAAPHRDQAGLGRVGNADIRLLQASCKRVDAQLVLAVERGRELTQGGIEPLRRLNIPLAPFGKVCDGRCAVQCSTSIMSVSGGGSNSLSPSSSSAAAPSITLSSSPIREVAVGAGASRRWCSSSSAAFAEGDLPFGSIK